ncbi:MAG: gliding motility protein GldN [Bacteroidetes bacterium]|nr:gliding motility protein GldN [Bacteroidota bacterium]
MTLIQRSGFILVLLSFICSAQLSAQKKKKTTTPATSSGYGTGGTSSGYGAPASGTGGAASGYGTPATGGAASSGYGSTNNNQPQPTNQPKINVPYEVVKSSGNPALDSVKVSQRNDASVERNLVKDRQPLSYEHIREEDAIYRQKIWREIDAREKINLAFRYANDEDNGNQRFIAILIKAIRDREVTAFDASIDDRFTTPLTPDQVIEKITGKPDTSAVYDAEGNITKYKVSNRAFELDSIYLFKVKEEWVFDKESSRLFVRILGIAPMQRLKRSDGEDLDPGNPIFAPMFWVYYPDCRGILSKFDAYNGKNYGGRMSWEELFENRFFSSYITKTTMDNPFNRQLKEYIKDPLYRLLEGENIKEKIFNYEQDLWSY